MLIENLSRRWPIYFHSTFSVFNIGKNSNHKPNQKMVHIFRNKWNIHAEAGRNARWPGASGAKWPKVEIGNTGPSDPRSSSTRPRWNCVGSCFELKFAEKRQHFLQWNIRTTHTGHKWVLVAEILLRAPVLLGNGHQLLVLLLLLPNVFGHFGPEKRVFLLG